MSTERGNTKYICHGDQDTRKAGAICCDAVLGASINSVIWIFLHGPLGAGKSTFVRGFLGQAGVSGPMPSPSYSLVEPYTVATHRIFHLDAYRLSDAAELEFLGLDQMYEPPSVVLVEWPENIAAALPAPSMEISLDYHAVEKGSAPLARSLQLTVGEERLQTLRNDQLWAEFDQTKV